jgi:RND superfamily putative drug exporter
MAAFSARRPWIAIGAWMVLVVACYLLGSAAGTVKATDAQANPGEAIRASQMVDAAGLAAPDQAEVLLTATDGGQLDRSAAATAVAALDARIAHVVGVRSVADPVISPDGRAMLVSATLTDAFDGKAFRAAVTDASTASGVTGLRIQATGGDLVDEDVSSTLGQSFSTALTISLPVTLIIMLVAFGALIAAGIPVLLGVTSVLSAVGLYAVASHVFPDGGQTAEVILLVGMAVGVDYSLFYLRREREERAKGRSEQASLMIAASTAGRAVVTSGVAVCIALAGMFLTNDATFSAMAVGTIAVVLLAVLGSLTVLPAILSLLGRRVDRPRIPLLWRLTARAQRGAAVRTLLRPALRHPVATAGVTLVGLLAIIIPAFGLQLRTDSIADLPDSMPSVVAYRDLVDAFPSQSMEQYVVVNAPVAQATATSTAVAQLVSRVSGDPRFAGQPSVRSKGGTTVVAVAVPGDPESATAKAALSQLRGTIVPATVGAVPGATVAVGGATAMSVDAINRLSSRTPTVFGFVIVLTLVLMTLAFSSLAMGLVTILVNLLSAAAAFGVLVGVFQHTWAQGLLGFHSTGGVIFWIPVFLFVILFGLSMDYHVLVVSRIKEAVDRGVTPKQAVADGVAGSAGVVTSAAVVMIAVFAIFAGLPMIEFKELGIGLSTAILLDAVVIRILLLPAVLALLGRHAWWSPRWLARVLPRRPWGDQEAVATVPEMTPVSVSS